MRLEKITYELHGQLGSIQFTPPGDRGKVQSNFFTIINGENGTGKSALLRAILDMTLGRTSNRQSNEILKSVKGDFLGSNPSRVIALSSTTNDRFPITSGGDIRLPIRRFDLEEFYYFGPKVAGTITSITRASSNIARAMLSGLNGKWRFGDGLSELMAFLDLRSTAVISFIPNKNRTKDLPIYSLRIQSDLRKAIENLKRVPETIANIESVLENLRSPEEIGELQELLSSQLTLDVDLRSGEFQFSSGSRNASFGPDDPAINLSKLSALLSLGLLRAKVQFQSQFTGRYHDIDSMSSGQWQLINCLFGLCVFLSDNSLVLVDEPENSLHPQWQRNYMSLIRKITSHRTGCHVIIATHSPFLVSSLLPNEGGIIRFERDRMASTIEAVHEEAAYGWIPGDVLRQRFDISTERPPEFEKALNSALQIMRRPGERPAELKTIARRLALMKKRLPEHDTILNVLNVIIETAGLRDESSGRRAE